MSFHTHYGPHRAGPWKGPLSQTLSIPALRYSQTSPLLVKSPECKACWPTASDCTACFIFFSGKNLQPLAMFYLEHSLLIPDIAAFMSDCFLFLQEGNQPPNLDCVVHIVLALQISSVCQSEEKKHFHSRYVTRIIHFFHQLWMTSVLLCGLLSSAALLRHLVKWFIIISIIALSLSPCKPVLRHTYCLLHQSLFNQAPTLHAELQAIAHFLINRPGSSHIVETAHSGFLVHSDYSFMWKCERDHH